MSGLGKTEEQSIRKPERKWRGAWREKELKARTQHCRVRVWIQNATLRLSLREGVWAPLGADGTWRQHRGRRVLPEGRTSAQFSRYGLNLAGSPLPQHTDLLPCNLPPRTNSSRAGNVSSVSQACSVLNEHVSHDPINETEEREARHQRRR